MHVMPTCHFDDARRRRLALLNDPKLLDRRPTPPPLRTRQNRNLAHVCSFACKSLSKLSQAKLQPGRRPSPEGYELNPESPLSDCLELGDGEDLNLLETMPRQTSRRR